MTTRAMIATCLLLTCLAFPLWGQKIQQPAMTETVGTEMTRLAKALVGDWDTVESMERSEEFPNGGGRQGSLHWKLGVGGTILLGEGHSDGMAGPLDYLILLSWNKNAGVFDYFVCFKDTGSSCKMRGTAHWEGNNFVNDYEEIEHGKTTKWRDSFVQIAPTSYTLIAARDDGGGSMRRLITTRCKRR